MIPKIFASYVSTHLPQQFVEWGMMKAEEGHSLKRQSLFTKATESSKSDQHQFYPDTIHMSL